MERAQITPKPPCPNCGKVMQLVPASPRFTVVPELPIFGCRSCATRETGDHEAEVDSGRYQAMLVGSRN